MAVAALLAALASRIIPYSDDEFEKFFSLACYASPYLRTHFDVLGNGCHQILRIIPLTSVVLPLNNASWYTGSINALLFAPLYALWASPVSARWFGLLFLLAEAFVLSRVFRLRYVPVAIALLMFFPFAFQHFADTGPLGLQILSLFLFYGALDRWIRMPRFGMLLLCTLLAVVGIWTKFTFVSVLPALVVLALVMLLEEPDARARIVTPRGLLQIVASAAVFCILVAALVFATHPWQPDVAPYFMERDSMPLYSIGQMVQGQWRNSELLIHGLRDPLFATHWIWPYMANRGDAFLSLYYPLLIDFVPAALVMLVLFSPLPLRRFLRSATLYLMFWVTLFVLLMNPSAAKMHNLLVAFPFLVLSACAVIVLILESLRVKPSWFLRLFLGVSFALFLALNTDAYLHAAPPDPKQKTDQETLFSVLRDPSIQRNYDIVILDYGFVFYQSLFGGEGAHLLYIRLLKDAKQAAEVMTYVRNEHRKALFVYLPKETSADLDMLRSIFPLEPCAALPDNPYFGILLEPGANGATVCTPR